MKKIITFAVLTVIGVAVVGLASARAEDSAVSVTAIATSTAAGSLEKIPSPDQIKYFKVIKKENGSLYGIRLSTAVKNQATEQISSHNQEKTNTNKAQLEKILAPQFINLYEKIQKIGNSLWGVKKETKSVDNAGPKATDQAIKPMPKPRLVTAEMIACVSAAIDKKDKALQNQIDLSAESLKAIISTRGECQKKAIQTTAGQLENLNICIKDFQAKYQEIIKQSKDEQQIIWKAYQSDLKACSASAADNALDSAVESSELMIEDGGGAVIEGVLMQ
ncbi:MAG TPA: hypothetical protein PLA05_02395 [bacterium]|jgi:hypothetical protein|nr:MAG: hypothetical protein BWX82_00710 [Parcubacteria group bacterium ADurb.Bin115]HNU81512.1 hypothetical protein [bacterium]HOD87145.1 hypothetical protein [bacterium]HPW05793.1 hypothetical protein [bacterium]HQB76484.1 hypothetical protein [bacterium]